MSAPTLSCIEINPSGPVTASIVWLHGLGADGHDFEPIVPELALPASLGLRFVFPHAPRMPVTINGGFMMRAWYDIASPELGRYVDIAGIRASTEVVAALVDREIDAGIDPSRIIVAGFSQGGVIALEVAGRYRQRLAGAMALSCYVADPADLPEGHGLPVFQAHGTQDNVVPFDLGAASRRALEDKGYAVHWRDYRMPHSVCGEEIGDIRAWLLDLLQD